LERNVAFLFEQPFKPKVYVAVKVDIKQRPQFDDEMALAISNKITMELMITQDLGVTLTKSYGKSA